MNQTLVKLWSYLGIFVVIAGILLGIIQGNASASTTANSNNNADTAATVATVAPTTVAVTQTKPETIAPTQPKEHTYEVLAGNYTWEEANEYAHDSDGYLVRIDDIDEWNKLTNDIIPNSPAYKDGSREFFVGSTRNSGSKEYYWVDNGYLIGDCLNEENSWLYRYDCWLTSAISDNGYQPSFYDVDTNKDEYYVEIFYRKKADKWYLNDVSILETMGYICEYE